MTRTSYLFVLFIYFWPCLVLYCKFYEMKNGGKKLLTDLSCDVFFSVHENVFLALGTNNLFEMLILFNFINNLRWATNKSVLPILPRIICVICCLILFSMFVYFLSPSFCQIPATLTLVCSEVYVLSLWTLTIVHASMAEVAPIVRFLAVCFIFPSWF